jgi:NADH:ubiquinone oxidoreductase subunit 3 (subunit A)
MALKVKLVGLAGLIAGMIGFVALNFVGYAIERRKQGGE